MTDPLDIRALIDTDRYPIDGDGEAFDAMLGSVQADLATDGCAVLKGFIRPEAIASLIAEADAVAPKAHRSFNRTNVYFSKDDPSLPAEHPARRFYDRSNSFVPADNFGAESPLRSVYENPCFQSFVQKALGEEAFFPYADPLADVIVNVVEEGGGFPWHFDTNNFTVTLAIQNGEEGGEFCYAPGIRTSTDENFDAVSAVLDGRSDLVKRLHLEPGDLQIFKGRYALHRVEPVRGSRRRYVGIFSFVEEPGMVATPERCKQLYGRVLPVHYERAGQRADALMD
ncbi:2OG-Fe(II) oxygenase [Rhodobacteraceae bacterium NNCM2]|nr:2OG-Fe(II) oxygenase [Coraliihabitans acroporae]